MAAKQAKIKKMYGHTWKWLDHGFLLRSWWESVGRGNLVRIFPGSRSWTIHVYNRPHTDLLAIAESYKLNGKNREKRAFAIGAGCITQDRSRLATKKK